MKFLPLLKASLCPGVPLCEALKTHIRVVQDVQETKRPDPGPRKEGEAARCAPPLIPAEACLLRHSCSTFRRVPFLPPRHCLSFMLASCFDFSWLPQVRPDNIRPILPHTGCKLVSQSSGSVSVCVQAMCGVAASSFWSYHKQR